VQEEERIIEARRLAEQRNHDTTVLREQSNIRVAEAEKLVQINKQVKEDDEAPPVFCIFGGAPELWKSLDSDTRKQRIDELMLQVEKMSEAGWNQLVANYKARNAAKSSKPQAQPDDQDDRDERDSRPPESRWPAYLQAGVATNVAQGKFRRMTKDEQWEAIDKYDDEEIAKKKKEEEDKIALAKLRADPLWPNEEEFTEISEDEYNAVHGTTSKIVLEARERALAYRLDHPEEWAKARQTPGPKRLLKWSLDMVYLNEPKRNEIRAKVPPQPECEPPTDPRLLKEWKGPTEDMLVTKDEWLARYALTESLRLEARGRVLALRDRVQHKYETTPKHIPGPFIYLKLMYWECDNVHPDIMYYQGIEYYRHLYGETDVQARKLDEDVFNVYGWRNEHKQNSEYYKDNKIKAEAKRRLADTGTDRFWKHFDGL